MFDYFPSNYTWSSAFLLGLMAGGQLGEMHRWLAQLKYAEPKVDEWNRAWAGIAQQEELAALDVKKGHRRSAGARYLRASMYRLCGERQLPPGPAKSETYRAALDAFGKAIKLMPLPIERVEVEVLEAFDTLFN